MPESKNLAKRLKDLCQLDIDAVHAYSKAIEHIDITAIQDQVFKFRADHERHIGELSALIRSMNETPPEFSRDFKGFLLEGFTALRSVTGIEGTLKALKSGEDLTNRKYADAMTWDISSDIKAVISRNYQDEQTHIAYMKDALNTRIWEAAGVR